MQTLNDTFNIETVEPVKGEVITVGGDVIVPEQGSINDNINYDYEKARGNLHGLLQQGQDALYSALQVANSSEHPRAFEVVGGLIKQLADINKQLLDLSETRQKLTEKETKKEDPSKTVTNNNAIFVGSTAELNKMLRNMSGE